MNTTNYVVNAGTDSSTHRTERAAIQRAKTLLGHGIANCPSCKAAQRHGSALTYQAVTVTMTVRSGSYRSTTQIWPTAGPTISN